MDEPRCLAASIGGLSFNGRYLILEIVIRLVLGGASFAFSRIHPFVREVYGDDWYNHYYPYVEKQVFPESLASIILLSCIIIIPILIIVIVFAWKRIPKNLVVEEIINFLLAATLALELDFAINELVKNTYGRPRPDYLSRCLGSDRTTWGDIGKLPAVPDCSNSSLSQHDLADGRKSFPSAHSSLSFAVYIYLALFIYRKLCQIKNTGSLRLVLPVVPGLFAAFIAITRTQDYRHFPTDVLAGALLGTVVSTVVWKFYDDILRSVYSKYRLTYTCMQEDSDGRIHDPYCLDAMPVYVRPTKTDDEQPIEGVPVNPSAVLVNLLDISCIKPDASVVLQVSDVHVVDGLKSLFIDNGVLNSKTFNLIGSQGNVISENAISENVVSENVISENAISENAISEPKNILFLHLGVSMMSNGFKLEKCAYNNRTFSKPDINGTQPVNEPIINGLELDSMLTSRLDLNTISDALNNLGFPVEISTDPGRYLCNMCYFISLHNSLHVPFADVLFVHVPPFEKIAIGNQFKFLQSLIQTINPII